MSEIVRLENIYEVDDSADGVLTPFRLLRERDAIANIGHREMPSWAAHRDFVASRPYTAWHLIRLDDGEIVGAIYLTKQDEIGIAIFKAHQRKGYGSTAVRLLMKKHSRARYLANISPANEKSLVMFGQMGFRHIQNTLELRL